MGLDIYVMPLWRFKAGGFATATESALGVPVTIITADGVLRRPATITKQMEAKARYAVEDIRRAVQAINQTPIRWNDDGEVVYSAQSRGIEPLRAYAKWLDFRGQLPDFGPPPEGDYCKHPAMQLRSYRPLSCPHLVEHDCFSGYYLPCEFELMAKVEPYQVFGQRPAKKAVGSSPRLLRELAFVQQRLAIPANYTWQEGDPLAPIKIAFLQMQKVAELSCRHGLPIIFWG